jgi:sugar lactone lactonase YvrE
MSYGLRTTYTAYVECDTVRAIDLSEGVRAMQLCERPIATSLKCLGKAREGAFAAKRTLKFSAVTGPIFAVLVAGTAMSATAEELFKSRRLTPPPSDYPEGIEGPAVDAGDTLYVVNFKKKGTIGRLAPGTDRSELFATLPKGSIGNGIRFDRDGRMYVADYTGHNIFVFERGQTTPRVYFKGAFNQPNDLAIAADGTLYASDPKMKAGQKNRIWRITRQPDGTGKGEVMSSEREPMGRVNGIDLSPDGATLYVSESGANEIWAYRLQDAKLVQARLLKKFGVLSGADLDGLRTDIDGRIFVAWNGNGKVLAITPDGGSVREIPVLGKGPSNLTFGGPDGMTVYVTQVDGGFVEAFRTDRPGREPLR